MPFSLLLRADAMEDEIEFVSAGCWLAPAKELLRAVVHTMWDGWQS